MKWFLYALISSLANTSDGPICLKIEAGETPQTVLSKAGIGENELLTRVVYAETISTNFASIPECAAEQSLIAESIAWGILNRVRLAERSQRLATKYGRGITGVVFKAGQFNPAVSARSAFSKFFICPLQTKSDSIVWQGIVANVSRVLTAKPETNPFLQTDWEKKNGVSLVSHFYYPKSSQAASPPPRWAAPTNALVTGVVINGQVLNSQCIQFFRHEKAF